MNRDDALSPGKHVVSVNGLEQAYHVAGRGPVCVAHSGGPGVGWDYLRMPLVEQHLTVIYLEPIGTGSSGRLPDHPNGYAVERYSEQVGGLLEALDLSGVLLLGHSHGGFVMQHYALAHPERVAGLIIYDSSPVTGPDFMGAAGEAVAAFARDHAEDPDARAALEAWQSLPLMCSDADYLRVLHGILPVYFADYRRADIRFDEMRAAVQATLVNGLGLPFDVREALRSLAVPTLILVGEHDFICGPRWAKLLVDLVPDAEFVNFTESGHFPHIEQARDFSEAVTTFALRSVRPAA